jgi:hypothetical protein
MSDPASEPVTLWVHIEAQSMREFDQLLACGLCVASNAPAPIDPTPKRVRLAGLSLIPFAFCDAAK